MAVLGAPLEAGSGGRVVTAGAAAEATGVVAGAEDVALVGVFAVGRAGPPPKSGSPPPAVLLAFVPAQPNKAKGSGPRHSDAARASRMCRLFPDILRSLVLFAFRILTRFWDQLD